MKILNRFLDGLLGARCRYGCGQRVFPTDVPAHEAINHAGDRLAYQMRAAVGAAAGSLTEAVRAMYRGGVAEEAPTHEPKLALVDPDCPACQDFMAERAAQRDFEKAAQEPHPEPFWVRGDEAQGVDL